MHMKQTNMIVVGAGLIGMSLAVALQNQEIQIKILEHHLPSGIVGIPDLRPLTLSFGSCKILQAIGIWHNLAREACPIHAVHVSNQGALGSLHFCAREFDVPALGYVVSFWKLQKNLYQRVVVQKNVEIIPITAIDDAQCDVDRAQVTFSTMNGQQRCRAELLVAADGINSTTRRLLNIPIEKESRNEVALIALLQLEEPHNYTAYERFTSQGTLAILPLFQVHQYQLVWSLSKIKANEVEYWSDDQFCNVVETIFKPYIGNIKSVKRGKQYPLQMIITKEQVRPSFVALGNAAHTLYPIAAQGFNLGLRDVAVLSEVLLNGWFQSKSLGNIALLEKYSRWRRTDQLFIMELTRGIVKWFGIRVPLINQVRGISLLAIGLLLPLKKRLAKLMMGLSGQLPTLIQKLERR